jgi:hypothetical protein
MGSSVVADLSVLALVLSLKIANSAETITYQYPTSSIYISVANRIMITDEIWWQLQ